MIDKKCLNILKHMYRSRGAGVDLKHGSLLLSANEEQIDFLLRHNLIAPVGTDGMFRITVEGRGCVEETQQKKNHEFAVRLFLCIITIVVLFGQLPSAIAAVSWLFF